jgi:hypothetical protein
MKPIIRKVTKNAGMNPVARAVARQRLISTITEYRISIYLMEDGESCLPDAATLYSVVAVMLYAMVNRRDTVAYRKLQSAQVVLDALFERDCVWHKADTVTLDNALQIIQDEFPKLPAKEANEAIQQTMGAAL